jgi:dihydropteroate synthase
MVSDSSFYELTFPGGSLSLNEPKVMGILNITPDSFHTDSRILAESELLERAKRMIDAGATILDIGGQSTRPGAERLDAKTEMQRAIPAIGMLRNAFPNVVLSIDTFYSEVAAEACDAGANIINDISGGSLDPNMFSMVAQLQVPYVLTHIQGEPQTMQHNPTYEDVVAEVLNYFNEKIEQLRRLGAHQIIVDPGFGFGKSLQHNLQLLRGLHLFTTLNYPILAGLSRKKSLQLLVGKDAGETLNATTVANTIALMNNASILRVHDVSEAVEAVKIVTAMNKA